MATITQVRDRFKNLLSSMSSIIISTFKDTEKDAVELQQDQWDKGQRSGGGQIGQYSSFTKSLKAKKGQETKFVNLQDSKELINSIKFISISSEFAEIDATDWKRNEVVSGDNNYGEDIFGLTDGNMSIYSHHSWFRTFTNKIKAKLWQK